MRGAAPLVTLLLLCAVLFAAAEAPEVETVPDTWFAAGGHNFRQVYDPDSKRHFFQNLSDRTVSWVDPRPTPPRRPATPAERRRVAALAITPFLCFFAAMAARVKYLADTAPELLRPTMKRKVRKQGWGRSKFKTGSNRMSQDGKGGRSANS